MCHRVCIRGRATRVYSCLPILPALEDKKLLSDFTRLQLDPAFPAPKDERTSSQGTEDSTSFRIHNTRLQFRAKVQPQTVANITPIRAPEPRRKKDIIIKLPTLSVSDPLSTYDETVRPHKPDWTFLRKDKSLSDWVQKDSTPKISLVEEVAIKDSFISNGAAAVEAQMIIDTQGYHGILDLLAAVTLQHELEIFQNLIDLQRCPPLLKLYSSSIGDLPRVDVRIHRLLLCTTKGRPFESESDMNIILHGFLDTLLGNVIGYCAISVAFCAYLNIGYLALLMNDYLHRDVSGGNLLLLCLKRTRDTAQVDKTISLLLQAEERSKPSKTDATTTSVSSQAAAPQGSNPLKEAVLPDSCVPRSFLRFLNLNPPHPDINF